MYNMGGFITAVNPKWNWIKFRYVTVHDFWLESEKILRELGTCVRLTRTNVLDIKTRQFDLCVFFKYDIRKRKTTFESNRLFAECYARESKGACEGEGGRL